MPCLVIPNVEGNVRQLLARRQAEEPQDTFGGGLKVRTAASCKGGGKPWQGRIDAGTTVPTVHGSSVKRLAQQCWSLLTGLFCGGVPALALVPASSAWTASQIWRYGACDSMHHDWARER